MFGQRGKSSGAIIADGKEVGYTLQCVHCGQHWQVIPGSGRKRGWCFYCNGPTCGLPNCRYHVPYEVLLEYIEATNQKNVAKMKRIQTQYPDIINLQGSRRLII